MPYFDEPVGRVKIQTTSRNTQRYYTTKRQIRDLLSNTPKCVRGNFADIYLQERHDRSMQSGTELAREIQLTDWSTAGEEGKLVFVVSASPSLAQFISLFTTIRTSTGFKPVTSRRSNQLSYKASDNGSCSFVGSYITSFVTGSLEPTNDQLPRQWLHSSVG